MESCKLVIEGEVKKELQVNAIGKEGGRSNRMIVKYNEVQEETVAEGVTRKVLAYDGKLMSVEFTFVKGAVGAVHHHPHEQIGYVVKGSLELEMDGKKQVIEAGDTYYVKPHVPHGVVALEESVVVDLFTRHREDFIEN